MVDSKRFFQEIRKIIKEEISIALNSKISEVGYSAEPKKMVQQEVKQKLKANPSLTDLLNETKDSMINDLTFTSADASGFNKDSIANILGYSKTGKSNIGSSRIPSTDIDGRVVQYVAPEVANAINKDYSKIMQELNKKK